jgi:hypothetical protein
MLSHVSEGEDSKLNYLNLGPRSPAAPGTDMSRVCQHRGSHQVHNMANLMKFKQSGSLEGDETLPPLTKEDEKVIMATLAQITPTGCDLQTPRKQARRPRSYTPERPGPSNNAEVPLEADLVAPKVKRPRGSINPTSDNEEVLVEGRAGAKKQKELSNK